MNRIEYILDFAAHLGREMLECGANLERATLSMEIICKTYQLREVSVYALSSYISISARENGGHTVVKQVKVPANGIHLKKLKRLNDLSFKVSKEKPEPEKLEDMLYEALMTKGYSRPVQLLGFIIAMLCLCRIFGGEWQDMIIVTLNTVVLFYLSAFLGGEKINKVITNIICMFLCGCIGILFTSIGFVKHLPMIIITNAFYLIPGIPMVNGVRNIVCGNEMNGIIELLKVALEVISIVAGLYIAFFFFGKWELFF